MSRVEKKFINTNIRPNALIARQIKALEGGQEPTTVLNQHELLELNARGGLAEYLSHLRQLQQSSQIADLSE